jgi:AcrR family transcriptional regulator
MTTPTDDQPSNPDDAHDPNGNRVDGRHARVDMGRQQAIDAAIGLLANGEPLHSIDQIAEASGMSRRTLFRYFGSLDGLVDELFKIFMPTVFELFSKGPSRGSVEERIRGLLSIHYEFAVRFGHIALTTDRIRGWVPRAQEMRVLREATFRRQTEAWLLPEFKRLPPTITTQILLLTNFDSVYTMRVNVGDQTIDALTRTIVELIDNN